VCVCLPCTLGLAEQPEAIRGSPSEIEGTWKGVYFDYPNIMVVRLNVRSLPMDHIEGECEISQAIKPGVRNAASHSNYRFSGLYTPWAKEFSVKPGQSIMPGSAQQPMSGVLDVRGDRLAGFAGALVNDQRPVVLAHNENGDQLVADVLASAYPSEAPRGRGASRPMLPDGADVERLTKWASRLETDFPQLDLRHTQMQNLYRFAQNLFADDWFKESFGTTFDKLDPHRRRSLDDGLHLSMRRGPLQNYSFLSSAFGTRGSF
jgi:hypothetical protein